MYRQPEHAATTRPFTDRRLADQYDHNVAVLGDDLGFSQREIETGVPPFEVVRDTLSEPDKQWINEQLSLGYTARLTIAPSLQAIGLMGERNAPGLIPRFDLKQEKVKKGSTLVSKAWLAYGDKYPVHDNGLNEEFSVAILLKPTVRTELSGEAKDLPPEQVLRNIGSVRQKMEALQKEHIAQAKLGRWVVSAPLGHLVSDEAQSRHAGERGFHHYNASCLVHYPMAANRRYDSLPTLSRGGRDKQRLQLNERMLFVASEAVLRVLHVPTVTART